MKIPFNSLVFKTLSILFVSSVVFIAIILISSNHFFTKSYVSMVQEEIASIQNNINPQISLNLSYDFKDAVKDIVTTQLKNKKILFIKIKSKTLKKTLIFKNTKKSIQQLKEEKHFFSKRDLIDPATSKKLGELTLIYSNKSYRNFMHIFYQWLTIGIAIFIISVFVIGILLYNSLKHLTSLAKSFEQFDPNNPKNLYFDVSSNDEIGIIKRSANILLNNMANYIKNIKNLHETITEKEAHLKQAQRIANIGSWEYDVLNKKLKLSDEIYRIFKLDLNTILTWDNFLSFISDNDYPNTTQKLKHAIEKGSMFDLNYSAKLQNGSLIDVHTRGKVLRKPDGSVKITAVSMDITQEKKDKQTIERLAYYDSLTSLPNRSLLKDRIHKAIQVAKREKTKLAILFLDLDHFKLINDTLGHDTGDKLLIYVSNLLKKQLRESDTIARIGGDEFVVLLPNFSSTKDIDKISNKFIQNLHGQHIIDNHQLYITTSIGIAIYPDNGKDLDTLMTNADTAMYDAKRDGRNNYKFFSKNMTNFISKQIKIEQDLRDAILNKNELEIYYQPKISSSDNSISGAEALIRWNHPTKGVMCPDEFISVAESTGLIIELGNWIIEECICNVAHWNKTLQNNLNIAINLSAKQFQNNNLVPFISLMIEKHNINPSQLEFEITESLSMSNIDATLRVLSCLREIGVSIAIDDFGTGYSSLSYLKKFPINTLKIDKSFVMDMTDNEEDKIIVETIITMAHSLSFKTIAEGVETKNHIDILKGFGCDDFQGYYYSKPITKNKFENYVREYITN